VQCERTDTCTPLVMIHSERHRTHDDDACGDYTQTRVREHDTAQRCARTQ
jgi:hypothetical protein